MMGGGKESEEEVRARMKVVGYESRNCGGIGYKNPPRGLLRTICSLSAPSNSAAPAGIHSDHIPMTLSPDPGPKSRKNRPMTPSPGGKKKYPQ